MPGRHAPLPPIETGTAPPRDYYGDVPKGWLLGERFRKGRAYPEYPSSGGVYNSEAFWDFPIVAGEGPPIENIGIYVVNRRGVVQQVRDDWVTEDGEGRVYVRGIGVFSYATDEQILEYQIHHESITADETYAYATTHAYNLTYTET